MGTRRLNDPAGKRRNESFDFGLFRFSVVLTAVAFGLMMSGTLSRRDLLFGIFGAAILQILVHLYYFLHLDAPSTVRWNVLALVFTVLILVLFVGGTPLDHGQHGLSHDVTTAHVIKKYILVTKPGIVFGNLITAAGGC